MFYHPSRANLQRRSVVSGEESRVSSPASDFVDDILGGSELTYHHHVLHERLNQITFTDQVTHSQLSALNLARLAIWKDWGTGNETSSLREILSKEHAEVRSTSRLEGEPQPMIGGSGGGLNMQLLDE